jgi:heme exporter protein A
MTRRHYPADSCLSLSGLACSRGERDLFEHLNLKLVAGRMVQLEGANGSGKTSLLRIIAGVASAEEGEVLWGEHSIQRSEHYYKHMVYIGHQPGVKYELTPRENLAFYQRCADAPPVDLEEIFRELGLRGFEDEPVGTLSAGQKRRVALARLFIDARQLWILDEPFTSLDKRAVARLEETFQNHLDQNGMIVLTTHQPLTSLADYLDKISMEDYRPKERR